MDPHKLIMNFTNLMVNLLNLYKNIRKIWAIDRNYLSLKRPKTFYLSLKFYFLNAILMKSKSNKNVSVKKTTINLL